MNATFFQKDGRQVAVRGDNLKGHAPVCHVTFSGGDGEVTLMLQDPQEMIRLAGEIQKLGIRLSCAVREPEHAEASVSG